MSGLLCGGLLASAFWACRLIERFGVVLRVKGSRPDCFGRERMRIHRPSDLPVGGLHVAHGAAVDQRPTGRLKREVAPKMGRKGIFGQVPSAVSFGTEIQ